MTKAPFEAAWLAVTASIFVDNCLAERTKMAARYPASRGAKYSLQLTTWVEKKNRHIGEWFLKRHETCK